MVDNRFYKYLGPSLLVELLDGLDVEIPEGQFCDITINHALPVDKAGSSDISFLEGKGVAKHAANCLAGVCLVNAKNAEIIGKAGVLPLVTEFPQASFSTILDRLYRGLDFGDVENSIYDDVNIGKNVVIGAGAKIGAGTSIGPNTVIGPGVVIGENCNIGANVVIEYSIIGKNCKIYHGAILGSSGFGVAKSVNGCIDIPHLGIVDIGNDVTIGSQTTIDRAMFGATSVGNSTKMDNLIQIAHNVKIGQNCQFAANVGIGGSSIIGDGVIMGGKAGVPDHVTIGDGAMLSAMCCPMSDIPAGEIWGGIPAQPIRNFMREISYVRRMAKKPKKKL